VTYTVNEIYYTLQGEGAQTGRAAVFCRFAGCNLWSGREEDRSSAGCRFCDTDFVGTDGPGGGRFETPAALADAVARAWSGGRGEVTPRSAIGAGGVGGGPAEGRRARDAAGGPGRGARDAEAAGARPLVVCTGGEPLLQLDEALVVAFHARGLEVAVETNGTRAAPAGLDWVCVSPKAGTPLALTTGDELKLVYPQDGAPPEAFEGLAFRHFFLQPMDGPERERNTALATRYCLANPRWRLSLQTHKLIGIP
jgi:7-carboxy-7-deazaguanine synthase (Cx14CxxC type)